MSTEPTTPIPAALQAAAARAAEQPEYAKYPVNNFVACATCGALEWRSGQTTALLPGVNVEWRTPLTSREPCRHCVEAAQRAPEVVAWVMGAIGLATEIAIESVERRLAGELKSALEREVAGIERRLGR